MPENPMARAYLVLAVGIIAVSSAALLVSFARREGIPAPAIAALRLGISAVVLLPLALMKARREIFSLTPRETVLVLASGTLLGLHFAFWIGSLDYTSVMSSVVLVSTNPLFVGVASALILREAAGRWTVAGIVAGMAGGAVIAIADLGQAGVGSVRGDALALLGAVAVSGYLLIGRTLRKRMSLLSYVSLVYTVAAVVLLAIAGLSRTPLLGYPLRGYLLVVLLAAGPQLIGHTSYNWALKYVSATFVTVTLLAEPIGATLLAIPLLSQVPTPIKLAGGALILLGIYLSARGEIRSGRSTAEQSKPRI
jgi:drug/metabolite transporter (DMT)-like permease